MNNIPNISDKTPEQAANQSIAAQRNIVSVITIYESLIDNSAIIIKDSKIFLVPVSFYKQ